jgi:glutamate synthase domain-containing protein 2
MSIVIAVAIILAVTLVVVAIHDVLQRRHAILRNFPVIGHLRFLLEAVGPELRQYIVTDNDEERPFSRDQRRWVYASAKRENNLFGFGTDNDIELSPNYLIVKQSSFPLPTLHAGIDGYDEKWPLACAKILGGPRQRRKAFRPASAVNISAMSYGSLSSAAVEALNRGAKISGCLHNTGEGGVSPYHRVGGDLIWQLGTGYFGARGPDGEFSMDEFRATLERSPTVRAIEIKLSQGAKPGHGGILPGAKVTAEIAKIRGVPVGQTVESPASHSAFSGADEMLDFVERLADESGLPVGIKSAVGQDALWHELAALMRDGSRGVDFITIDGGEGGTGAAPLAFTDHVAMPFKLGMAGVYRIFAAAGLTDRIVWIGSGKLGFPAPALLAFGLGCDVVSVAREAMLALGCIQAQRCHTGHCPTGVATQNAWLMRGLDPTLKSTRLANYVVALRKEITELSRACGVDHPAAIELDHFAILDDALGERSAREVFGYEAGWGVSVGP